MMGNWNRCLMLAQGKYVAYLHDDDLLNDNYLQEITKILTDKRYSDAGAVCAHPNIMRMDGQKPAQRTKIQGLRSAVKKAVTSFRYLYRKPAEPLTPIMSVIMMGNIYRAPTCGAVFNKEALMNDGGWAEEGYPAADWLTCLRFNQTHKVYFLRQKLGVYRLIKSLTLSVRTEEWAAAWLCVLCRKWQDERVNKFVARHKNMIAYLVTKTFPSENAAEICSVFGITLTKPSRLNEKLFRGYKRFYAIVHNIDW